MQPTGLVARLRRIGRVAVSLGIGVSLAVGMVGAPAVTTATVSDSLRVAAASTAASIGDSFTVHIIGNTAGKVSGAEASLTFDKTLVQVTSIAKGANWTAAAATWVGWPTALNLATFLANANAAGKIPGIAATFLDGSSFLAAGDHELYSVTFSAIANGSTSLDLPIGPADGYMTDGETANYGLPLSLTATPGSVTVAAHPTAAITALPLWLAATDIPVAWSGTPAGAAIATYDVRYRRAAWNGAFGVLAPWQTDTAATGATFVGLAGSTYCFSARSKDGDGLYSAWTAETCTATPLDERSMTKTGSWTRGTSAAFFRSTYSRSTSTLAKLTRTGIKAKRIAIVATTCPTCGSVKVYLGTTLLKTISLRSATTINKRLITVKVYTSVKTGTIVIKPGTAGKKTIIDGLVLSAN